MIASDSYYQEYRGAVWAGLLIVLVVLGGLTAVYYNGILPYSKSYGTAMLKIEGEGYTRAFEGEVVEGMTVFEAIQASSTAGNISFKYTFVSGKLVVESFNGYVADSSSKSLDFYLNSSRIEADKLHNILIKGGDVVLVKIQ